MTRPSTTSYCTFSLVLAISLLSVLNGFAQEKPNKPNRKAWTTSKVTGSPLPPKPYRVEQIYENVEFKSPVELVQYPVTDQWIVLEVNGGIYSLPKESSKGERKLVFDLKKLHPDAKRVFSVAFHPDVKNNKEMFVVYTTEPSDPKGTHVSRFKLSSLDPPVVDPKSEETIIEWL